MESDLKVPLLPRSASDASEPLQQSRGDPTISIIGSGDFSRSLSMRLVACGFRVVVGSRRPNRVTRSLFPEGVELRCQREAVDGAGRVVFVAVHPEYYPTLVGLREQLAGKVLVDVSNATRLNSGERSNAETLAELFPDSRVVKGFNVVSAWALQAGAHDGNRKVRSETTETGSLMNRRIISVILPPAGPDLQRLLRLQSPAAPAGPPPGLQPRRSGASGCIQTHRGGPAPPLSLLGGRRPDHFPPLPLLLWLYLPEEHPAAVPGQRTGQLLPAPHGCSEPDAASGCPGYAGFSLPAR